MATSRLRYVFICVLCDSYSGSWVLPVDVVPVLAFLLRVWHTNFYVCVRNAGVAFFNIEFHYLKNYILAFLRNQIWNISNTSLPEMRSVVRMRPQSWISGHVDHKANSISSSQSITFSTSQLNYQKLVQTIAKSNDLRSVQRAETTHTWTLNIPRPGHDIFADRIIDILPWHIWIWHLKIGGRMLRLFSGKAHFLRL